MESTIARAANRLRERDQALAKTLHALARQRRNRNPFRRPPSHRRDIFRDARTCRSSSTRMPEKAGVSAAQIANRIWLPWPAEADKDLHRLCGRGSSAGIGND